MAEVYVTLNEAAELEEVKYNTMVQKIKRKPDAFLTQTAKRDCGG